MSAWKRPSSRMGNRDWCPIWYFFSSSWIAYSVRIVPSGISLHSLRAFACAQEPDQRSCPESPAASGLYSSDQILVSQPLAGRAVNEAVDALRGVPFDVAFVETEGEFIDIAVCVLRADMVECAVNATLEDGEETFDAVRRHVAANELGSAVINRLMGKPV